MAAAEDESLRMNRGLGMLLNSIGKRNPDGLANPGNDGPGESNNGGKYEGNKGGAAERGFGNDGSGFSGWDDVRDSGGNTQHNDTDAGNEATGAKKGQDEFDQVNSWAGMKMYDNDHDTQWFADENARLAKLYGGKFIVAKYLDTQPGKVGYYCEICFAEMNARKSLDLHCSGMKHLKKKAMWEKMDETERNNVLHSNKPLMANNDPEPRGEKTGAPFNWPELPSSKDSKSSDSKRDSHSRRDDYRRRDDYDRRDYDRRGGYDRGVRRAVYESGPVPYIPPLMGGGPHRSRWDSPESPRPFPGPDRGMDRHPRDRYNPYDRQPPPPPSLSRDNALPDCFELSSVLFEGISDSSCSEILKKLAACRVKNAEDGLFAANIAAFLVVTLKDFYEKSGQMRAADVLYDINDLMSQLKRLIRS